MQVGNLTIPWFAVSLLSICVASEAFARENIPSSASLFSLPTLTVFPLTGYGLIPEKVTPFTLTNHGVFAHPTAVVERGTLEIAPYNGDWLPRAGGYFSTIPVERFSQYLVEQPSFLGSFHYLNVGLRQIADSYLSGTQPKDHPLSVIEKLAFLETRLQKYGQQGFIFDEISPDTMKHDHGSIKDKFYSTEGFLGKPEFIDRKAPGWWGHCDRLAAANLDRNVYRMRQEMGRGYLCGKVPISGMDLEDTFTFFHYTDDRLPKYGANRGNLFDRQSLSSELLQWEEFQGTRPLDVESFIKLLHENVQVGASGIIIDESSDPRDLNNMPFQSIWNRPVFNYVLIKQDFPIEPTQLTTAVILRYGIDLLKSLGLSKIAREFGEAIQTWHDSVTKINRLNTVLLRATYHERLQKFTEPHFDKPKLSSLEALDTLQRERVNHQIAFSNAMNKVEQIRALLAKQHWNSDLKLSYYRLRVGFARQRDYANLGPGKLSYKNYDFVALKIDGQEFAKTWNMFGADYPPDFAFVPKQTELKNLQLLRESLQGCSPIDDVEEVIKTLQVRQLEPKHITALEQIASRSCIGEQLDRSSVVARLREISGPQVFQILTNLLFNCKGSLRSENIRVENAIEVRSHEKI